MESTRGRPRGFDRDEALARATEHFWQHGYEASGMNALLESMGIARQSLYAAFGDKRSLFLEALHKYYAEFVAPLGIRLDQPGSVLSNFEAVFTKLSKDGMGGLEKGCMLANAAAELAGSDEEVSKVLRKYLASMERALSKALRRGQECGEIRRDVAAESLARAIVTTIQGASLMGKLPGGRGVVRDTLNSLLAMLAAK